MDRLRESLIDTASGSPSMGHTRMQDIDLPIKAAREIASAHGVVPDRCDILQNGSTLVLRLSETLVARIVTNLDGPRQGKEWYAREIAVAAHLARHKAPVIPLHPAIPPEPYEHLGFPMNFWQFVTATGSDPDPEMIGKTLHDCHEVLLKFDQPLPNLEILEESIRVLELKSARNHFSPPTLELLRGHLTTTIGTLGQFPSQPLHGDAHLGNLMNTTSGLLWTDWEDTFTGPVEWDLASAIWNILILEEDQTTVDQILGGYRQAGGEINPLALHHSLIGRAAVMSAWYPILYPHPSQDRQIKLQRRLDWLKTMASSDQPSSSLNCQN